ncbi:MAG TPA: hypothetical protein PLE71_17255 [Flavobacteriales bacterium]|nr:hypothetical protein [Flavobacteriales bacterium]HRA18575.1 hypothetical protein [Flavobacteriales bacterium]
MNKKDVKIGMTFLTPTEAGAVIVDITEHVQATSFGKLHQDIIHWRYDNGKTIFREYLTEFMDSGKTLSK